MLLEVIAYFAHVDVVRIKLLIFDLSPVSVLLEYEARSSNVH